MVTQCVLHLSMNVVMLVVFQRHAVDEYLTGVRLIEVLKQSDARRFSRAGRSDESHCLSGLHCKREILKTFRLLSFEVLEKHRLVRRWIAESVALRRTYSKNRIFASRWIAEVHIAELDSSLEKSGLCCSVVKNGRHAINVFEDL